MDFKFQLNRAKDAEEKRQQRLEEQKKEKLDEELKEEEIKFSTLKQEVEFKTKKLRKYFSKYQQLKQEIQDLNETNFKERQELEQTQTELLRDIKLRQLIIDNFIPNDEREKLTNRLYYDPDEDRWKPKMITKEKLDASFLVWLLIDRAESTFSNKIITKLRKFHLI